MANNMRRMRVVKSRKTQLAVMMTMEASTNYPSFDDPVFMDQFDIEMSYRREVHVTAQPCTDSCSAIFDFLACMHCV